MAQNVNSEKLESDIKFLVQTFQTQINSLKQAPILWEDFYSKASKFHSSLRVTMTCMNGIWDAFQHIADYSCSNPGLLGSHLQQETTLKNAKTNNNNSPLSLFGPEKRGEIIGPALIRLAMRHKALDKHLQQLHEIVGNRILTNSTDTLEEWKRGTLTLEREHERDYKKYKVEIKKLKMDMAKLVKKMRKDTTEDLTSLHNSPYDVNNSSKYRDRYNVTKRELERNLLKLHEIEMHYVRTSHEQHNTRLKVWIEKELKPILEVEGSLSEDMSKIKDASEDLYDKCLAPLNNNPMDLNDRMSKANDQIPFIKDIEHTSHQKIDGPNNTSVFNNIPKPTIMRYGQNKKESVIKEENLDENAKQSFSHLQYVDAQPQRKYSYNTQHHPNNSSKYSTYHSSLAGWLSSPRRTPLCLSPSSRVVKQNFSENGSSIISEERSINSIASHQNHVNQNGDYNHIVPRQRTFSQRSRTTAPEKPIRNPQTQLTSQKNGFLRHNFNRFTKLERITTGSNQEVIEHEGQHKNGNSLILNGSINSFTTISGHTNTNNNPKQYDEISHGNGITKVINPTKNGFEENLSSYSLSLKSFDDRSFVSSLEGLGNTKQMELHLDQGGAPLLMNKTNMDSFHHFPETLNPCSSIRSNVLDSLSAFAQLNNLCVNPQPHLTSQNMLHSNSPNCNKNITLTPTEIVNLTQTLNIEEKYGIKRESMDCSPADRDIENSSLTCATYEQNSNINETQITPLTTIQPGKMEQHSQQQNANACKRLSSISSRDSGFASHEHSTCNSAMLLKQLANGGVTACNNNAINENQVKVNGSSHVHQHCDEKSNIKSLVSNNTIARNGKLTLSMIPRPNGTKKATTSLTDALLAHPLYLQRKKQEIDSNMCEKTPTNDLDEKSTFTFMTNRIDSNMYGNNTHKPTSNFSSVNHHNYNNDLVEINKFSSTALDAELESYLKKLEFDSVFSPSDDANVNGLINGSVHDEEKRSLIQTHYQIENSSASLRDSIQQQILKRKSIASNSCNPVSPKSRHSLALNDASITDQIYETEHISRKNYTMSNNVYNILSSPVGKLTIAPRQAM